jgi:hypothetical protein
VDADDEVTIADTWRAVAQPKLAAARRWVGGPALAIWQTPTPSALAADIEQCPG